MTIQHSTISKGFILAGATNASVLVFSRLFTNPTIPAYDPEAMSNFGLLMIFLWGLAYISVAKSYQHVKWLVGVFAIEKLVYGYTWIKWLSNNSIAVVFEADKMAGIFYAVYGINDLSFFIFFALVFIRLSLKKDELNNIALHA